MASVEVLRPPRPLRPTMLGYRAIDSEHIEITDCWSRLVRCQPIQFPFFMARLKRLMRNHFAHEAQIMAGHNGTLCACHQQEHDGLLALCDSAARLSESNWRRAQTLLRTEFPKRVREHIICMDQQLVMFINTAGTSGKPASAGRH